MQQCWITTEYSKAIENSDSSVFYCGKVKLYFVKALGVFKGKQKIRSNVFNVNLQGLRNTLG